MQGSKQDSFVKVQKKNRRFDDGVGKATNSKKFANKQKSPQDRPVQSH